MGNQRVNGGNGSNGADGASAHKRIRCIAEGLLNYLKLSGELIEGRSYGSEKIYMNPASRSKLFAMATVMHLREYGQPMLCTDVEFAEAYADARKGNYKLLEEGTAIPRKDVGLPLFGIEHDLEPIATVYAYWGSNQKAKRWLVKIGYTADDLGEYLKRHERAYSPELLATIPGARQEERLELAKWRRQRHEGREWFRPSEAMVDAFRREWNVATEFEQIAAKALEYEAGAT